MFNVLKQDRGVETHAAFQDILFIRSFGKVEFEGRLASLMTPMGNDEEVPDRDSLN